MEFDGQSCEIRAKRDQADTTAGDAFDAHMELRSVQISFTAELNVHV